jgi:pimeloyl-ACP methyl ester carboxylesterase
MPVFTHPDGTRTAYDAIGAGSLLLLIHGAEGSRRSFDRLVPLLSDHFRVVSYDQRDCGETQNSAAIADLERLGDDASELLAALDGGVGYVFGTSFGGRVAQALAIRHPERVERLVLGSTWAVPRTLAELNGRVAAEVGKLRAGLPASAPQLAEYFFPSDFLAEQPAFRQHFAKVPIHSERSERRGKAVGRATTLEAGRITAKTLLLAGGSDRLVPAELTEAMKHDIADSACVVLGRLGHVGYIQSPQQVADQLIRFLVDASNKETV